MTGTADEATAILDGVHRGEIDQIDMEAILMDYDEWVRESDSPVAIGINNARETGDTP